MADLTQTSTSLTSIIQIESGLAPLSLTNYSTSALSAIAQGSAVEVGSAIFYAAGDVSINASSWTAITTATSAYLALTPSGVSPNQILSAAWTSTAPVWRTDFNGWYASAGSNVRVIGSAYKTGPTSQESKALYMKGRETVFFKEINIGDWDMDATVSVSIAHGLVVTQILAVSAWVRDDNSIDYIPAPCVETSTDTTELKLAWGVTTVGIARRTGGPFDSTDYNATGFNRGKIIIWYRG